MFKVIREVSGVREVPGQSPPKAFRKISLNALVCALRAQSDYATVVPLQRPMPSSDISGSFMRLYAARALHPIYIQTDRIKFPVTHIGVLCMAPPVALSTGYGRQNLRFYPVKVWAGVVATPIHSTIYASRLRASYKIRKYLAVLTTPDVSRTPIQYHKLFSLSSLYVSR